MAKTMKKPAIVWVLCAVLCVAASAVALALVLTRSWWLAGAALTAAGVAAGGIRRFHPDNPKAAVDHG